MSHKIFESRLIRLYLMAMAVLAVVAIGNGILTLWITKRAVALVEAGLPVPAVLDTVADTSSAGAAIGGAVATITTALIARYGLREATGNIGTRRTEDTDNA